MPVFLSLNFAGNQAETADPAVHLSRAWIRNDEQSRVVDHRANESGCGGAALERRNFGETIVHITKKFPHWFCPAFATFADRTADLPVDSHVTLAMAAPRPLYVASAVEDLWADPRGEFLGAVAASPVWRLFGREGLGTADWPPVGASVGDWVGYHVRAGKHDLLAEDWERFADFVDRHHPRPAAGSTSTRSVTGDAFRPVQHPLPVKPPADAVLLFGDGSEGPPRFTAMDGGQQR